MRNKITMEMSICQAEIGFALDELVKKFTDSFENKAFADILKMNLQLTQEVLIYRIFNDHDSQQCFPDGHLMLNGSFECRIRTSLGEFKMDFWRVRCSKCGKTFAPLAKFIGLERYQTKSNELEKLVIEAVSGNNYRIIGIYGKKKISNRCHKHHFIINGNHFFTVQNSIFYLNPCVLCEYLNIEDLQKRRMCCDSHINPPPFFCLFLKAKKHEA